MKTATMTPPTFGMRADAPPFHPASFEHSDFGVLYNDGVPGYVVTRENDVAKVLHGIQDQAIDENFPPTAQDAAEMEAVQAFVEMMATLAFLEEHEEEDRFLKLGSSFEKRWETRRAAGLTGKPNPAKGTVQPKDHNPRPPMHSIKSLVKMAPTHVHPPKEAMMKPPKVALPKTVKHATGRHPIQQPRKQN